MIIMVTIRRSLVMIKLHYLFEDGDFSAYRIKKLIKEGEEDAMKALIQEKKKTEN
jgi:hypothetical protein